MRERGTGEDNKTIEEEEEEEDRKIGHIIFIIYEPTSNAFFLPFDF